MWEHTFIVKFSTNESMQTSSVDFLSFNWLLCVLILISCVWELSVVIILFNSMRNNGMFSVISNNRCLRLRLRIDLLILILLCWLGSLRGLRGLRLIFSKILSGLTVLVINHIIISVLFTGLFLRAVSGRLLEVLIALLSHLFLPYVLDGLHCYNLPHLSFLRRSHRRISLVCQLSFLVLVSVAHPRDREAPMFQP